MSRFSISTSSLRHSQSPSLDKARPGRQGLPSGYRMRHDAHYVDELESRRRPSEANGSTLAFPPSIPVTFALRDMSQELEAWRRASGW